MITFTLVSPITRSSSARTSAALLVG